MCEAVEKYGESLAVETTATNVKKLMKNANYTLEQAFNILEISDENKVFVMEKLSNIK